MGRWLWVEEKRIKLRYVKVLNFVRWTMLAGREGRGEECGEVGGGDRILKEESSLSTRKMEKEVGGKVEEVDLIS